MSQALNQDNQSSDFIVNGQPNYLRQSDSAGKVNRSNTQWPANEILRIEELPGAHNRTLPQLTTLKSMVPLQKPKLPKLNLKGMKNKIDEIDAELPEGAKSPIAHGEQDGLERSELISEHSFANKMFIQ